MTDERRGAANGPHVAPGEDDGCSFGLHLSRLRDQLGLSRGQLCQRSGVSVTTIRRIELGTSPTLIVARKLSIGLELPLFAVLNGAEPSPEGALHELVELLEGRDAQVIGGITRLARVALAEIEQLTDQE